MCGYCSGENPAALPKMLEAGSILSTLANEPARPHVNVLSHHAQIIQLAGTEGNDIFCFCAALPHTICLFGSVFSGVSWALGWIPLPASD